MMNNLHWLYFVLLSIYPIQHLGINLYRMCNVDLKCFKKCFSQPQLIALYVRSFQSVDQLITFVLVFYYCLFRYVCQKLLCFVFQEMAFDNTSLGIRRIPGTLSQNLSFTIPKDLHKKNAGQDKIGQGMTGYGGII